MLAARLYRAGSRWLPLLPEPLLYGACELLALLVLLLAARVRRAVLANLHHVAAERRGAPRLLLAQQVVANAYKHYVDLMRLPSMPAAELARRFELCGVAQLQHIQAAGRGAILAVPHCGSYSLAIAALADQGLKLALVVERLQPPEMLEVLNKLRQRPNLNIIPLGPEASRELLRALRRGELIVLAADRDLAGRHVLLPFFGKPAPIPLGPATLACHGLPILTACTVRLWGSRSIGFVEQLPSPSEGGCEEIVTQQIVERLETYIRRFPESWGVLQPVWPERQT